MENKQPEQSQAELYRQERKERLAKAAKKNAKKSPQAQKISKIVGKVISIILVVAIVLGAIAGILNFFGAPQMVLNSAKFGTMKVTVAKYNFYYMETYQNIANQAQQYDSYYGKGSGLKYTGYDYTKTPMEQSYTQEKLEGFEEGATPTWADFIRIQSLKSMQQICAYADLALKNELELTEEQKADMEKQIEQIRKNAQDNDYALDRFLQKIYGKGVTEKVLREVMEERALAQNYIEKAQKDILENIAADDITTEINANPQKYNVASLGAFAVKIEPAKLADTATEEEKATATENAKTTAKEKADQYLEKITDIDTLVTQAKAYDKEITKEQVVAPEANYESLERGLGKSVADWVYAEDRAVGDKAVLEIEGAYVIVYLTALPHQSDVKPVDVRHILIEFPKDEQGNAKKLTDAEKAELKETANSIYEEFTKDPTEEHFAELATAKTQDPGSKEKGGLYEQVKPGDMVKEFDEWCFNEARKAGDTGIVETQFGYHIMYFVGNDHDSLLFSGVKTQIASEKVKEQESALFAEDGEYAIRENKTIIKWAAKQQENLIKKQYIKY